MRAVAAPFPIRAVGRFLAVVGTPSGETISGQLNIPPPISAPNAGGRSYVGIDIHASWPAYCARAGPWTVPWPSRAGCGPERLVLPADKTLACRTCHMASDAPGTPRAVRLLPR